MTREDIIAMAQECQLIGMRPHLDGIYQESLERFAALVAAAERKRLEATAWGASKKWIVEAVAAEREACAKVAEEWQLGVDDPRYQKSCADAIRARGQA
jgi:hypothetical protein